MIIKLALMVLFGFIFLFGVSLISTTGYEMLFKENNGKIETYGGMILAGIVLAIIGATSFFAVISPP